MELIFLILISLITSLVLPFGFLRNSLGCAEASRDIPFFIFADSPNVRLHQSIILS